MQAVPRLTVVAFDTQGAPRSRPHSAAALKWSSLCSFVSCLYFPLLPPRYWHLLQQKSCLKHRKPPLCHVRGRAGQRAHQCRPLSSSICSLNRKISRTVLKVETLDKKRICRGLRKADTSNLRYFMCVLVTEVL